MQEEIQEDAGRADIEVRGLVKRYGKKAAVDGIDLAVEGGSIFGYIGPNGAGKSTTIKVLTGLTSDFEGDVRVAGLDPRQAPQELKGRIGYVPENARLYEALTVAEHLLFIGRLHGMEDALIRQRSEAFLDAFDLRQRLGDRVASLSKGMRQKLLLTSALLHDPVVLFLDEPLSGLDVHSTILVKELLRSLADRGRTIFYSSHVMDVVERMCDRIAIIDTGRKVTEGTFEELHAKGGGGSLERIVAELTGEGQQQQKVRDLLDALEDDHV